MGFANFHMAASPSATSGCEWKSPDCFQQHIWNFLLLILLFSSQRTSAEGFRNPPAGAFGLGRAGGRIAQIDEASAVTHNPANLVELKEAEFSFASTIVYIQADYESPGGLSARTRDPWKALPGIFASFPIKDDRFAVGLGVTAPYGISNEWEPNGPFRYTAPHFTELKTINANPSVSLRLADNLTAGAGVDVMWSQLDLRQFYPWALVTQNPADADGLAKGKGDGVGLGGNLGLTWQVADRHRLAVTYRSPITIDYSGNFHLNNVPAVLGGGALGGDFKSKIKFPTIVSVGYGVQVSDTVRLEADVEWLQFSRFDSLPVGIQNPPPGIPANINQAWRDTFTAGLGGDWKFAPRWALRASYQYYQSPVPDKTFSPTIPDANQNVFTLGLAYQCQRHNFEIAYGGIFYDDRKIVGSQNPAYDGNYQVRVHLFAFAYRFQF